MVLFVLCGSVGLNASSWHGGCDMLAEGVGRLVNAVRGMEWKSLHFGSSQTGVIELTSPFLSVSALSRICVCGGMLSPVATMHLNSHKCVQLTVYRYTARGEQYQ